MTLIETGTVGATKHFETVFNHPKNSSKKGAAAELQASIWFLANGYEVFRNMTPSGSVDLIALKGSKALFVDVKSCQIKNGRIQINRGAQQKISRLGGHILYVFENGECKFDYEVDANYGTKVGELKRINANKIKKRCVVCGKVVFGGHSTKFCSECKTKKSNFIRAENQQLMEAA